jgi:hypothetical protein
MANLKLLSAEEIELVLAKLPNETRLDLLGFALDLVGFVNPAANVASAGISLWRGDFFGAAVSAISVIPVGNLLKIAKLEKYAKLFETLVLRIVPTKPELYKLLTPVMTEFRSVLAKIPAGNRHIETIREMVSKFFRNAELYRLSRGLKGLEEWAEFASKRGRWKNPAYAKAGTTPANVVERLLNAAENGPPTLRMNAKEVIHQMGEKDWVISAGPHRTTATAGAVLDQTPHITVEIAGQPHAYHLRLDKGGHVWEIRTMGRVEGELKPVNPVSGTPRPWVGPGR